MNPLPHARLEKKRGFPFVWIIPLVSLAMAGVFAWQHYQNLGPRIFIHFSEAEGIVPDKTRIKYLGVIVGTVGGVSIDSETAKVLVTARLARSASGLAREGTTFVLVKPVFGFKGVEGLTTIFSGTSLELRPGKGEPSGHFKGYADAAALMRDSAGLSINLTAPRVGSLAVGNSVLYRGIKVGEVTEVGLSPAGDAVLVRADIEAKYQRFVRTNSIFWDESGLHAKFGLFGGTLSLDSLQGLLSGAIEFTTPGKPGPEAKAGAGYTLYAKADPDWDKQNKAAPGKGK